MKLDKKKKASSHTLNAYDEAVVCLYTYIYIYIYINNIWEKR